MNAVEGEDARQLDLKGILSSMTKQLKKANPMEDEIKAKRRRVNQENAELSKLENKKAKAKALIGALLDKENLLPLPLDDPCLLREVGAACDDIKITYHTASSIPKDLMEWAFRLIKTNMKESYERCPGWGWKDRSKRKELMNSDARFLIAEAKATAVTNGDNTKWVDAGGLHRNEAGRESYNNTKNNYNNPCRDSKRKRVTELKEGQESKAAVVPVAFVHLRFEIERNEPVLYIWEIQVEKVGQGKGIGKYLMRLIDSIARKFDVPRLMLTVFRENTRAMAFYRRLGFIDDESSPDDDHGYAILSKETCLSMH